MNGLKIKGFIANSIITYFNKIFGKIGGLVGLLQRRQNVHLRFYYTDHRILVSSSHLSNLRLNISKLMLNII